MSVNLSKQVTAGGRVNLTKEFGHVTEYTIGLGWDVNRYDGADYDLDLMAFMLGADGKVLSPQHFVFYGSSVMDNMGRKCDPQFSLVHTGDNRTGAGEGDDEQMLLNLAKVDPRCQKIVFAAVIYENGTNLTFGQVDNAFLRLVDTRSGAELLRSDISNNYSSEKALIFAEVFRNGGDWTYRAVLQGYNAGLVRMCQEYGFTAGYDNGQTQYGVQPQQGQSTPYGVQPIQGQYGAQPIQGQYGAQPIQGQYGTQPQQGQYGAQPQMGQYGTQHNGVRIRRQ